MFYLELKHLERLEKNDKTIFFKPNSQYDSITSVKPFTRLRTKSVHPAIKYQVLFYQMYSYFSPP